MGNNLLNTSVIDPLRGKQPSAVNSIVLNKSFLLRKLRCEPRPWKLESEGSPSPELKVFKTLASVSPKFLTLFSEKSVLQAVVL